ncbi:hypothetical protein D3C87_1496360 [compost metagenome]
MRFILNQDSLWRSHLGDADQEGIYRHIGGDRHGSFQHGAIVRAKFFSVISMIDPQVAKWQKQRDANFGKETVLALECPPLDMVRPLSATCHDIEIDDST